MAIYPAGFHSAALGAEHQEDVWGGFEDFERTPPPPPCRTIMITPQVRALDALKQVRRVSAWSLQAEGKAGQ